MVSDVYQVEKRRGGHNNPSHLVRNNMSIVKRHYWTDKEGRDHVIEYMDDYYLINCITLIENLSKNKEGYRVPPVYYSLIDEYNRRVDR